MTVGMLQQNKCVICLKNWGGWGRFVCDAVGIEENIFTSRSSLHYLVSKCFNKISSWYPFKNWGRMGGDCVWWSRAWRKHIHLSVITAIFTVEILQHNKCLTSLQNGLLCAAEVVIKKTHLPFIYHLIPIISLFSFILVFQKCYVNLRVVFFTPRSIR